MNLRQWLDKKDLQAVATDEAALAELLRLVDRDLRDCRIAQLSADRRFATAYGAALNLASYVIRREGFRVSARAGHHRVTFEAAAEILGSDARPFTDTFDLCRRKRNQVDYSTADVVTDSEVTDLIELVVAFQAFVRAPKRT